MNAEIQPVYRCPTCNEPEAYRDGGRIYFSCLSSSKATEFSQAMPCRIRELEQQLAAVTAERDGLKRSIWTTALEAAPDDLRAQIARLQGDVATQGKMLAADREIIASEAARAEKAEAMVVHLDALLNQLGYTMGLPDGRAIWCSIATGGWRYQGLEGEGFETASKAIESALSKS